MLASDLAFFGSLLHLLYPMGTCTKTGRHRGPSRSSGSAALERPHRPRRPPGRHQLSRLPSRLTAAGVTDASVPGAGVPDAEADRELLTFHVRLAKQRQGLLDTNRIERKAFREHARIENAAAAYARELGALFDERGFTRGISLSKAPAEGGGGADRAAQRPAFQ